MVAGLLKPSESQAVAQHGPQHQLVVLVGPTGSGKSRLAVTLAETLGGEIVSCDSVAVYRGLEIGSAKPSAGDRRRVPHHCLDLFDPNQPCTAGDYARAAREALGDIRSRGCIPLVVGGTGLYLRALLEGLALAPQRNDALRQRLCTKAELKGSRWLHRLLGRLDPRAADLIHPNDTPKLVRSLEVSLLGRRPQTQQWSGGREALTGYDVLRLGLDPPRPALYSRLNERAAAMFREGLLEEADGLIARFGSACQALGSLGYLQARGVLGGTLTLDQAVAATQQGHRNYAKRQLTWFRRDTAIRWLHGFGDDPTIASLALEQIRLHLSTPRGVELAEPPELVGQKNTRESGMAGEQHG